MVRRLAGLVALGLCAAGVVADSTKPGKVTVEGAEVRVTRALDSKKYTMRSGSTSLTVVVNCPGKQVLNIDPSSKVTELRDDKDTDLTKAPKAKAGGVPLIGFRPTFTQGEVARDRSGLLVAVYAGTAPARGATKIHLKGDLILVCGTDEKTTGEKEVEFKKDAQAKVGDFTLKVNEEKGFLPNSGGSFTVTSTAPSIKTVNVKDADGKTVDVMTGYSYGFGKNWSSTFSLKRPVKNIKVSITYFAKQEKVNVPVDVSLGLGL